MTALWGRCPVSVPSCQTDYTLPNYHTTQLPFPSRREDRLLNSTFIHFVKKKTKGNESHSEWVHLKTIKGASAPKLQGGLGALTPTSQRAHIRPEHDVRRLPWRECKTTLQWSWCQRAPPDAKGLATTVGAERFRLPSCPLQSSSIEKRELAESLDSHEQGVDTIHAGAWA